MGTTSTSYDWSAYTPVSDIGEFNIFKSAYANVRWELVPVTTYMVTDADTANLVGISHKLYGDVSLWHLLLAYNGIQDPIQDVYPGVNLKVPSKTSIIDFLNKKGLTLPSFTI